MFLISGEAGSGPGNPCTGGGGSGGPPCDSEGEKYVGVFMLAQIIHGIGFTPMFTLGIVYLDENCGGHNGALYIGKIRIKLNHSKLVLVSRCTVHFHVSTVQPIVDSPTVILGVSGLFVTFILFFFMENPDSRQCRP